MKANVRSNVWPHLISADHHHERKRINANARTQTHERQWKSPAAGTERPAAGRRVVQSAARPAGIDAPRDAGVRRHRPHPGDFAKPHPAESSGLHPTTAAFPAEQISQEHADERNHRAPAGARSADQRRRFLAAPAAARAARVSSPPNQRIRAHDARVRGDESARLARWRYTQHGGRNDGADARGRRANSFRHHASGRGAASGPRDDFLDALFAAPRAFAASNSGRLAHAQKPARHEGIRFSRFARVSNHRGAQSAGKRASPQRSAFHVDGRDGRRRHADDAAAIARRDDDAVSCRPRDHGAHTFLDMVSAQPESRRRSAAARRAQRCSRRIALRVWPISSACPI